jgi:hypothetical protein
MATITVDVDVYLNEFDEDDIVNELEHRGYYVRKDTPNEGFDREDWQFLLDLLDKQPETWYTRRVREKLSESRFQ